MKVHQGVLAGLVAQAAVLAVLAGTVGVRATGWSVGLVCGVGAAGLLARALVRSGAMVLGPADLVTLLRAVLVGGVAALVADSFAADSSAGPAPVGALTTLAVVALALDGVDGRVARRTGTVSAVGARFDMEVDSALVLLLAVYVARSLGPWVLAIGTAPYVLAVARRWVTWLRGEVAPRFWCKVVAVIEGVVLTTVAAGLLPRPAALLCLVLVGVLLVESFGREVWELWRASRVADAGRPRPSIPGGGHG
ncbi:CDP-alcohol phosphatidyltransferase family protein [Modestobacter sp. URMC 112]